MYENNEIGSQDIIVNLNDHWSVSDNYENPPQKLWQIENSDEINLKHFKSLILTLEAKQLAESITFVSSTKYQNKQTFFKVDFEESFQVKDQYIEESVFCKLDQYRENSLLSQYSISQKSLNHYISQNFIGFNASVIQKNGSKLAKGKSLINQMKKKMILEGENSNPVEKSNFSICHFCRNYMDHKYMVKCNYKSSNMGLPVFAMPLPESTVFDSDLPSRRVVIQQRKRNNFSQYMNENNELSCGRFFCISCIKQNSDQPLSQVIGKNDWICPFCQGSCYCTRCLRNDMLIKLKNVYMLLGGDPIVLQQESLLEKHINMQQNEIKHKKIQKISKPSNIALREVKPQKNEFITQKIRNIKDKLKTYLKLKKIRSKFEQQRILLNQILKREKKKHLLLQNNMEVFKIQSQEIQEQIKKIQIEKLLKKKIQKESGIKKMPGRPLKVQKRKPGRPRVSLKQIQIIVDNNDDVEEVEEDEEEEEFQFSKRKKNQQKILNKSIKRVKVEDQSQKILKQIKKKIVANPNQPVDQIQQPQQNLKNELQKILQDQNQYQIELLQNMINQDDKNKFLRYTRKNKI